MTEARTDIVSDLRNDHEHVKKMFSDIETAAPDQRSEVFQELIHELVRHEMAEDEIVYPEVRRVVPNGERLANARIKEQGAAEELLAEMEKVGTDDPRFERQLERLRKAVLKHAEKEETLVFEPLGRKLDQDQRSRLGGRYERAKEAAPTHPHPHAPDTPPGNMDIGPVAAPADRARDAVHKASS